jgi:PKD repeat protein
MLKKISVLLVVSMLVITSIIIVTNNHDVQATQEPRNDPFDYQLIYEVAQNLSWRINQSYNLSDPNVLAKGRYFGSQGEHDAANFLAWEMGKDNINLYDPPDIHTNTTKPFHQKIVDGYNTNLEINSENLTIHHGNQTTYLKDFYTTTSNNDGYYTNLQIGFWPIINLSLIINNFFNATLNQTFIDDIITNVTLLDEDQFENHLTTLFEHYYNFTFEDILNHPQNATNVSWYHEIMFPGITSDYLAFGEDPAYNPNMSWTPYFDAFIQRIENRLKKLSGFDFEPSTNNMLPIWFGIAGFKKRLIARILYAFPNLPHHCRGIILYDQNHNSYEETTGKFALPYIYINGTLGDQINQSKQNYRIDFKLSQNQNNNVDSYNVIGQINGTDREHTTLVEVLYDSLWTRGTADAAIGCGMVLAFAKYMKYLEKNLSIIPKQNVRFVFFGGEEEGLKGAFYYEDSSTENITTVIDLNQLGYDQRDPDRSLIMNVATNKIWFKQILDDITGITDYQGRKNDGTVFRTDWTPIGSWSDERAFALKVLKRPYLTTAMFLKDFNWTRHHHDGENHTAGDTMDFYDESDIRLDMEMIWNVTRFFLYNQASWFENVTYTYTDGDDHNSYNDAVNVSFTIHTTFPEDKATVKLILVPTYTSNPLNPGYPILYRYHTEKQFIITPTGTSGCITLQLPKGAPEAKYAIHLILLDSRGAVLADNFGKGWFLAQGFQKIYDFLKSLKNYINDDYTETLQQNSETISDDFHLNIMDFIHKFPLIAKFKDMITDILTIYCLSDDKRTDYATLFPPNDPPNTPGTPTGPQIVLARHEYDYTTKTTDPNDDQVEYKWRFHLGDLFRFLKWSAPTDSGENNTQSNSWEVCGPRWVFAKARDTWHSPNVQSGYSEALPVLVLPSLLVNGPNKMLVGESVPFSAALYGAELYQIQWDTGLSKGWEHIGETSISESYSDPGFYNVKVDVHDQNQKEYMVTKQVEIMPLISNFTADSGNTNETLWFNDTSRNNSGYEATNRTWDFDDGNVSYGAQNVNHTFLTPGVYDVSLTVKNEPHNTVDVIKKTISIENDPPVIVDVTSYPIIVAPDCTVTLYADTLDSASGIKAVTLNITLPDSSSQIITMNPSEQEPYNTSYDFIANFTDTSQIGDYFYSIKVEDNSGNTVEQGGFSFTVSTLAFLPQTPYYGPQAFDYLPIDLSSSQQATEQHYAFAMFNSDVVLWMPMDATADGEPLDVSGYGNSGVGHGGVGPTEEGFFGEGFQFDGTNDYLEVASNSSLAFNAFHPMTWSLWVRPGYSSVNKTMGVLSKACSNGSGFTFCLNTTSNDAQFVICKPDKGGLRYSTKVDLNVHNDTWAQLAIVYNGSSGWDVYVNGSKRGSLSFPVVSNTNMSYLVGAGRTPVGNNAAWFFKGTLDDITMFTRGLGVDEIQSLYNASAYPYAHTFTGLSDRAYTFTGCAGYLTGCANRTETRSVLVDTQPPVISDVSHHPAIVGFGGVVQINASVVENGSGLLLAGVNISYPNATWRNVSMTCSGEHTYQYNFSDTWWAGCYNYTVWAVDNVGNIRSWSKRSFNVTVTATVSISTLKDTYSGNQYVNITDPPNPSENLTLFGRGLTWNTYYNTSSGENILESYQGPVNYQDDNSSWMPINTSLCQLASSHPAYGYGYRIGNDRGLFGVFFKPDVSSEWPVAFMYNRSADPTVTVVRSKLVGVGYLDPASNWSYHYLQNAQSSQGQTNDYAITYPGVFTGTNITWSYGNTGLKEAITMSNATKTVLQNHPPHQYGLQDASSYLVFITKLDYQSLNLYNASGMLNGNVTISDTGVDLRDALGQFKCALPLGDAYSFNNESMRQKLTYRIIHVNGNTYLLSGLKVSKLNTMTFPVIVDPTLTVYSTSSDGYIYDSNTNYNTAQAATSGTVNNSGTYITIGQKKQPGMPTSTYYVYRGFVFFDTSALPSNAYLDNATLSLYKKDDYSTTDFNITIQNGQPTYPHDPMQTGDYNKNYYSGNGGSLNTSLFTSGYNDIKLNSLSWINRVGITKLCLRSSRDLNARAPTGNEYVNVHSNEFLGMCPPKLVINYRNQSKIKNTGSTNIKGYLLIQVQFYDAQHSRWVVDKDTINETSTRTINSGTQLALDTIFNRHVRASDLTHGTGTYRVYAAFRDPYGNILKTSSGVELKAWWQFTKT